MAVVAVALALAMALAMGVAVAVSCSGAGGVYLDLCNALPRDLGARALALPAARTSAGALARAQLQRA